MPRLQMQEEQNVVNDQRSPCQHLGGEEEEEEGTGRRPFEPAESLDTSLLEAIGDRPQKVGLQETFQFK
jgi:hypothetical protein